MSTVLFVEPRQAPLIREAESAASSLVPGKALGLLLAATDRELRQSCSALQHEASANAGASALLQALRSFLSHLEQPDACRELILGCLNHMVEAAPPKKAGQQPRTVRLLLTASGLPRAWNAVCAVLDTALARGEKKLKFSACIILREVLVAHLLALEYDPRHARRAGVGETSDALPQAQAIEKLQALVKPLLPLTETLQSVAELDGKVDSANARCDPLPTRLTTLAADCCIAIYTALGRIALLQDRPLPTAAEHGHRSGVTIVSSSTVDDAVCADSSDDDHGQADAGNEQSLQDGACAQLWRALPLMEKLLRLLRQWYSGRKATLVIGIDGFLARLAPLSKFFAFEHHLRDGQKDADVGRDGGGLLGFLWAMLGPPLMAEGDGLVQGLENELAHAERALPTNAIVLTEEERKHCELPCEMAVVSICLLLGRAKSKMATAVLADGAARILPLLLQVLHTGWEAAARVSAGLSGVLLSQMSTEAPLQQLVPSLMTMLDTADTAAEAVVALLAQALMQATAQVEAQLMEQVLAAVDSTSAHRRDNGVKVLEQVVRLQRQVLHHGQGADEQVAGDAGRLEGADKGRRLMDTLCRVLLTRLGDEELTMRCRSSELLAHGQPRFVLPPLCRLLYARDARARAAAERAIVAVLAGHRDPLSAAETLLDAIRLPFTHLPHTDDPGNMRNPSPAPQHPGHIASPARAKQCASQPGEGGGTDEDGAAGDWPARVLRLLPKWLESQKEARQTGLRNDVARLFVSRVFAAPHDTALMKACSTVSVFLAQQRAAVLPLVHRRMRALAENEKASLPGGGVDSIDDETRRDLLFARLSPLLILKVLPKEAFAVETRLEAEAPLAGEGGVALEDTGGEAAGAWGKGGPLSKVRQIVEGEVDLEEADTGGCEWAGDEMQCVSALFVQSEVRLFDCREFKPVREVAAEVMARMPPEMTAPLLRRCLARMLRPTGCRHGEEGCDDGAGEASGRHVDDAARTALLVLCHAPACHGLALPFRACIRVVQLLLAQGPRSLPPPSRSVSAAAAAVGDGGRPGHLQEGCVAALSAAIVGQLTQVRAHGAPRVLWRMGCWLFCLCGARRCALALSMLRYGFVHVFSCHVRGTRLTDPSRAQASRAQRGGDGVENSRSCPVLGPKGLLDFACRAMARHDLALVPAHPAGASGAVHAVAGTDAPAYQDQEERADKDAVQVEQPEALQMRACHLLATAARALPPTSEALRSFSKCVVPTCLRLGASGSEDEAAAAGDAHGAAVRGGCIQVLFIILHGLGEQAGPLVPDALDIAHDALVVATTDSI